MHEVPEARLATLEERRQQVLSQVRGMGLEESVLKLAEQEIALQALAVKNHMVTVYRSGFELEDDLSRVEELYRGNGWRAIGYRGHCNGINYHLGNLINTPEAISREGSDWMPKLAIEI